MFFVGGFILACVVQLSFSQGPHIQQNSPLVPEQPPSPPRIDQGLVIPQSFQNFGFTNTGTSVWKRRQGTEQINTAQTATGFLPSTSDKSSSRQAGGMVVHPFLESVSGVDSVSTNNVQSTQQGGGTPVQFPSDTSIGQLPTENVLQPIKNRNTNTNLGTSSDRLINGGSTTGIRIPTSTFNANTNTLLSKNTGSTSTGVHVPMTTFNVNTNSLQNKNALNTGSTSTGVHVPMTTFNVNTNSLQNKNALNTGSTSTGVQVPFNTFIANANKLLNNNVVNSGSTTTGVQIPMTSFNVNENRLQEKIFPNTRSPSEGLRVPINTFNTIANRLPNENIKSGATNAISRQSTNNIKTPVGVQSASNVVLQNQEFTQVGKTAFESNPNDAFKLNPNLNSALGFGNNINNLQNNMPYARPCSDSLIRPAYHKSRSGNMIFDPTHFILGSSKIKCAYGTGFSLESCRCEFITDKILAEFYASIGASDWATRCNEDLIINFNNGIYDSTIDSWYVNVYGINSFNGVGHFNGKPNTSITIPRYRGYDLQKIAFEFKFRSNITHRDHPHPLFTNCESHSSSFKSKNEEPTYGVILNSNSTYITFFVTFEKRRAPDAFGDPIVKTQFISMELVNPLVWNTIRYSYDGKFLTAELNGEKKRKPAAGVIADRYAHQVSIGHCLRYGNFIGEMDDIKLYTNCIPRRF